MRLIINGTLPTSPLFVKDFGPLISLLRNRDQLLYTGEPEWNKGSSRGPGARPPTDRRAKPSIPARPLGVRDPLDCSIFAPVG